MILSRNEILNEVRKGRIAITPFDEKCVGPCSVDLHLGNAFRVFSKKNKTFEVNEKAITNNNTKTMVVGLGGIVVAPRELILGVTQERIRLSPEFCARIDGRSRFARLGLAVHLSSSLVQPGVDNVQVLEILNSSPNKLRLRPGLKICQLVFEELKGKAVYRGAYRTQQKP